MGQQIELIAGLGNPDPQYLTTRHNAGFWFADALAKRCGASFGKDRKLHGETAEIALCGQRIRLLKPMTYMNESGRALAAAVHYYKIPIDRVLVVYDELDLPPGRVKLKFGGGHAGHNGIRSVIEQIGADFWRLRLGVGHPGPGERSKVVRHVLQRAGADEERILEGVRDGLEALPILLEAGAERAQNRLHTRKGEPAADADTDRP
jgi:peptidyl-tRNA hydrolase, PTH1 family